MTHGWVTPAVVGMPVPLWSWRWAGRHADPSAPLLGRAPGRLLRQYRPLCNSPRGTKQWAEPPGPSYCERSSGGSHNLSACNNNTRTSNKEMAPEKRACHGGKWALHSHACHHLSLGEHLMCNSCSQHNRCLLWSEKELYKPSHRRDTYELTHSTTMFFHRFLVLIILTMQVLWGFLCSSCSSSVRKHETHTLRPFLSEGNERLAAKGPFSSDKLMFRGQWRQM